MAGSHACSRTVSALRGAEARERGSTALDRWLLSAIQRMVPAAPIRFALWDGVAISKSPCPIATIRFLRRAAIARWLWDPELNFGETYLDGTVELEGDLVALLEAIYRTYAPDHRFSWWPSVRSNDADTAKDNVHRHYDLGNEFYRLWLDPEMVYTCAYFPTRDATLEAAQLAKMDLVCRKLDLRPGHVVVEAGCGWGSLALFMARNYGVSVKAFNISSEQVAFARARARREGLGHLVEFVEDDYRNISGTYDAFVSIGMLEHVGLADFGVLGAVVDRVLAPNGRALLHFIGRNRPSTLNRWIRKRIFPGAYPPTLREVSGQILEPYGFSTLDVENLRLHYALTLDQWRQRFENAAGRVADMFDERFVRAWRLYLAGSQAAFATGWMQLFQVLFARGNSNAIPWRRVTS